MKPSHVVQLRELSRCWMKPDDLHVFEFLLYPDKDFQRDDAKIIRRLWHQYRHQIAAMRKNGK